jgi:hypothetical protein
VATDGFQPDAGVDAPRDGVTLDASVDAPAREVETESPRADAGQEAPIVDAPMDACTEVDSGNPDVGRTDAAVRGECWWVRRDDAGYLLEDDSTGRPPPDDWPASPKRSATASPPAQRVDRWRPMASAGGPSGLRDSSTAVWTGEEMIVWGGWNITDQRYEVTGARYNLALDRWTPVSTSNAPRGRNYHVAVWTGKEMLVFGGWDGQSWLKSGARYNPTTDTWTALPPAPVPEVFAWPRSAWTGSEWLVWPGGTNGGSSGYRFDPNANTWRPMSSEGAPVGNQSASVVWTGKALIVWGGYKLLYYTDDGDSCTSARGAMYHPATDRWRPMTETGAPHPRNLHAAVWTGTEMFVWGGVRGPNSAGYDPVKDTWMGISEQGAPAPYLVPALYHLAEASGPGRLIGLSGNNAEGTLAGGVYDIASDTWLPMAPFPSGMSGLTITLPLTTVWTGKEMIVWRVSGDQGAIYTP